MNNISFKMTILCFMMSGFLYSMDSKSLEAQLLQVCQRKMTYHTGDDIRIKMHSLLSQGADATIQDGSGMTPLMHTLSSVHSNYDSHRAFTAVAKIVGSNLGVNKQDGNGNTALMYLCTYCGAPDFPYLFQYFLDAGADVTIQNHHGKTALDMLNISENRKQELLNMCQKK